MKTFKSTSGKQTDFRLRPSVPTDTVKRTETMTDEIRTRAYQLYEDRGRVDGYDLDDWLRAEAEILLQSKVA